MKASFSFKLKQKVLEFIKDNEMIRHGDSVVVGLSGGADSVCLILLLNEIKKDIDFDIKAVHINHGIRGESADRDEAFSKALCERLSVPFECFHIDVPTLAKNSGLTLEEAGRNARYECYAKEGNLVALAHHIDDQAETVLFNIVRGSGIKGVGGIEPVKVRDDITVIRPLLCISKDEIIKYLQENGEEFCVDETNLENDYSRNLIRNEIMKDFNSIQPQSARHIADMAAELREAESFIYDEAVSLFNEVATEDYSNPELCENDSNSAIFISVKGLKDKPQIVVRYMIIYTIKQLVSTYKDITRTHIEDVYSLLYKGKGKMIMLPFGITATRVKDGIVISRDSNL